MSDARLRRVQKEIKGPFETQTSENPANDFPMLMCVLVDCAKDKTSGIAIESEQIPTAVLLELVC